MSTILKSLVCIPSFYRNHKHSTVGHKGTMNSALSSEENYNLSLKIITAFLCLKAIYLSFWNENVRLNKY